MSRIVNANDSSTGSASYSKHARLMKDTSSSNLRPTILEDEGPSVTIPETQSNETPKFSGTGIMKSVLTQKSQNSASKNNFKRKSVGINSYSAVINKFKKPSTKGGKLSKRVSKHRPSSSISECKYSYREVYQNTSKVETKAIIVPPEIVHKRKMMKPQH